MPPLHYLDKDNQDFGSLWVKIAQVVLLEKSKSTIKYVKSNKTMQELFEESGKMIFRTIQKDKCMLYFYFYIRKSYSNIISCIH